jgi:hypothetical protein
VTGNRRPEPKQLVASPKGAQEATSRQERGGSYPAPRLEFPGGNGTSDANNAPTNPGEEEVHFVRRTRHNGAKDFPDPAPDGPLRDTSRISAAAGWGDPGIPGLQAVADKCTAVQPRELGLGGQ